MAVHSKDGQTWLTKLDRISELSENDKAIVFNNLGHIINSDMLKELYQGLDRNKAIGIDGVTKAMYGKQLDKNISNLIQRLRRSTYQSKPARLVQIPKEDGSSRPLAISCLEDKLVQLAVSRILNKIYEPIFLPCSYGFRTGQSCHDALRALMKSVRPNLNGAVVEVDIRKYFNTIPHEELMKMLRNKVSDKRLLRLIEILIKSPIQVNRSEVETNTSGCPQGSILSPVLANIYLHHVIDEWFEEIRKSHIRGRVELIRYADDMVFTFEIQSEAFRFYKVLPKRFARYGLTMHAEKSQLMPSGMNCANKANTVGKRLPTYKFLGFTCYWGKSRKGYYRLKYSSRKDRFADKLKGMRKYLWDNLTKPTTATVRTVIRVVIGWMNYHNISDNAHRVESFRSESMRIIFDWINRKGRKHSISWVRFNDYLKTVGFPKAGRTISMFSTSPKMRTGR
jgi:RNA-directed DNA polymerase